jgi:hypothetical protein
VQKKFEEFNDFKNEEYDWAYVGCIFSVSYHPELNLIERVWAQLKRYTKTHSNPLPSLWKNIPLVYDSVSTARTTITCLGIWKD